MSDRDNDSASGSPTDAAARPTPEIGWAAPYVAPAHATRQATPTDAAQPIPPRPRYAPPAGYSLPVASISQAGGSPSTALGASHRPYAPAPSARPAAPVTAPRRSRWPGTVSLILALAAAALMPLLVSIAAFEIGRGTMTYDLLASSTFDWSILTPVRSWVLVAEVSFWIGTVCGIWAIAQGIVAVVRRSGRGLAIAAVIIAAVGPLLFFVAVQVGVIAGAASGISAL